MLQYSLRLRRDKLHLGNLSLGNIYTKIIVIYQKIIDTISFLLYLYIYIDMYIYIII